MVGESGVAGGSSNGKSTVFDFFCPHFGMRRGDGMLREGATTDILICSLLVSLFRRFPHDKWSLIEKCVDL